MSELSDMLGGVPQEVSPPDFVLSPLRLAEYAVLEDCFARWHVRRARRMCRGWSLEEQRAFVLAAHADVREGQFTVAMPGYEAWLKTSRGTRLAFWLMLRIGRPNVTRAEADAVMAKDEDKAIQKTFVALGVLPPEGDAPAPEVKKKSGKTSTPVPLSPSGGNSSTPSSGESSSPTRSVA